MKKILCIGECVLDIVFQNAQPIGSMIGGRIANAAIILAGMNTPVAMASELARDNVGDIILAQLQRAGVDTTSVDRFTEGRTPLVVFPSPSAPINESIRYELYPPQCFDIVWPRINEGDIVIFGGFYALDPRMHPRLSALLAYAHESKATIIYIPGFNSSQEPRITRVMPTILENLELASLCISRSSDLEFIFSSSDAAFCFKNHISFYCNALVNVDPVSQQLAFYTSAGQSSIGIEAHQSKSLVWNSGVVAGVAQSLYQANQTDWSSHDTRHALLLQAVKTASETFGSLAHDWQKQH